MNSNEAFKLLIANQSGAAKPIFQNEVVHLLNDFDLRMTTIEKYGLYADLFELN